MPVGKRHLNLFPDYIEQAIRVTVNGITKPYAEKLPHVHGGHLLITKPPAGVDLTNWHVLTCWRRLIHHQHHRIAADRARPTRDPESTIMVDPNRLWCDEPQSLCIKSRYALEGKLPTGIRLANKLEEGGKKISDFIEFRSGLRVWPPPEIEQSDLVSLTGLHSSVTGVLEQTIFNVNQVMQFGKLVAVLQEHPSNARMTVATVFMVLAIETDIYRAKREFESVPVLRNLKSRHKCLWEKAHSTPGSIRADSGIYTQSNSCDRHLSLGDFDRPANAAPAHDGGAAAEPSAGKGSRAFSPNRMRKSSLKLSRGIFL